MRKYWLVIKDTWDEILTYRLSFIVWRIRTVFQLLTVYFLWLVLIPQGSQLFGYTQSLMLTYILGTAFLSSVILATRSYEMGENINNGDLSIFLIRPINYFYYWFARDIGDKAMNISFAVIELSILVVILKPPLFFQHDMMILFLTAISITFSIIMHFLFGSLLGMIGFWSPDVWAPRFIFFIIINFFAGMLFPIDILPKAVATFFQFTPFPYLLYFPIKIYLGQLNSSHIYVGILTTILWTILLSVFLKMVWLRGLRFYTAQGH
ncbi:MAG: ABC-2 family transporter protein [Candidatus Levybacteria bacterium]|nr:ABC-2 family transporter protein [Candidatus Levybacteria bacterium]